MVDRQPVVCVVNRVVDSEGNKVRQECMVDGQAVWVEDKLYVPLGVAKIMIHQSMFVMDPVTRQFQYKLGCDELRVPTGPLPLEIVKRIELIDRSLLPGKTETRRIHNPITRHESMVAPSPGSGDGAHQGTYGDVRS